MAESVNYYSAYLPSYWSMLVLGLTRIDPCVCVVSYYWGGVGYSLASAIMLSTSLYQMWVMSWRGQISHENAWSDGRIKG
ncbi:hypothetical protein SPONN_2593 [uncultured Candidatus Thioglobus sp.]|nr:hypothetical protein SPONN_2593 [uncultured Candidatus Thioglobus sp.]SMM98877.1 hypothetical protein SPONL_205 [uncultured Candidatus Thioglobus sp.]